MGSAYGWLRDCASRIVINSALFMQNAVQSHASAGDARPTSAKRVRESVRAIAAVATTFHRRPRAGESALRLSDSYQVAGRIANGKVADAPVLIHRLLDDIRAGRLHVLERPLEVTGREHQPTKEALGE
jgi:hypothetical protein